MSENTKTKYGAWVCLSVGAVLFLGAMLFAFPAFGAFLLYKAAPIIAVPLFFAVAICFALKRCAWFLPLLSKYFLGGLVTVVFGLVAFLFCLGNGIILHGSYRVINGLAVDASGTIIPVAPWLVFVLYATGITIVGCVIRHWIWPLSRKGDTRFDRAISLIFPSAFLFTVFHVFTCLGIHSAYQDRNAERRVSVEQKIDAMENKLVKLRAELDQVNSPK